MTYCGMMKICDGTIIWNNTSPNIRSLPGNLSLAKAYPAKVAVATAQITRKAIISSVFMYSLVNPMVLMTNSKLSNFQLEGRITNGSTWVDSLTVLNAVRIIHTNGTSMVIATKISMR